MDGQCALLVGGPFDGTIVLSSGTDEWLVDTHLYESVDHWTQYQGERVRVYVHTVDCCDLSGGAEDTCG